jgi:hypothetical protein
MPCQAKCWPSSRSFVTFQSYNSSTISMSSAAGYPNDNPVWANTLIYLVAHPSQEQAKKNWEALHSDLAFPEYRKQAASIGAAISPFGGFVIHGYYSESTEAFRQAVNQWIRTSGSFDAVIDFDAVYVNRIIREDCCRPSHQSRICPEDRHRRRLPAPEPQASKA